jgi:hypothetical protein
MKIMKMNDCLYEAIKKSMVEDLKIAYEVFKDEGYENLEGVILALNPLKDFGSFIKNDPVKLGDFYEHLYSSVDFIVHIAFNIDGEDEFYPLLGENL